MRGTYDTPKRDHVIKTRLDDDEYEFFLRKCKVYGMNQSEMIRASLDMLPSDTRKTLTRTTGS